MLTWFRFPSPSINLSTVFSISRFKKWSAMGYLVKTTLGSCMPVKQLYDKFRWFVISSLSFSGTACTQENAKTRALVDKSNLPSVTDKNGLPLTSECALAGGISRNTGGQSSTETADMGYALYRLSSIQTEVYYHEKLSVLSWLWWSIGRIRPLSPFSYISESWSDIVQRWAANSDWRLRKPCDRKGGFWKFRQRPLFRTGRRFLWQHKTSCHSTTPKKNNHWTAMD